MAKTRNQYNQEEITSKKINDIKDLLCYIESKLSNLDDLLVKVDILKFDWIANKIKNGNQKLMIILISTFFMVLFYIITSYFNKERISMGTLIQILIGAPLFVQLIISLVKNEKSQ